MGRDLVIGIDAGTVGIRAGLFDLQGQPLGFYDQSYQTFYPQPGWAEQHPADWWNALVSAVQGCLHTSGVDGNEVIGLPISLTAVPDAVSLGSAICAAVGAGAFADLRAAGQAMVRLSSTVEPVASRRAVYNEGYARYKATYTALAPLFQRTHELKG